MNNLLTLCKELKVNAHLVLYLYFNHSNQYNKLCEYYHLKDAKEVLKRTVNNKLTSKGTLFSLTNDEINVLLKEKLIDSYDEDNIVNVTLNVSSKTKMIFDNYVKKENGKLKDIWWDDFFFSYPFSSVTNEGLIFKNLKNLKLKDNSFNNCKEHYLNLVTNQESQDKVMDFLKLNTEVNRETDDVVGNDRLCKSIDAFIINDLMYVIRRS